MFKKVRYRVALAVILTLVVFGLLLVRAASNPFEVTPYSFILKDRNGDLIGGRVASDGQWRFPGGQALPEKYKVCLLQYEDRSFYYHPGFDPAAIIRAISQNQKAGKTVSGASTISMQVVSLSRGKKASNFLEKAEEMLLAMGLELRYSKKKILSMYADHAPFGGNVVGLDAACFKYFGKEREDLSWAEAAMLAVLPNNPSMIHPGKNRTVLLNKRNKLLERLLLSNKLDRESYELSLLEPLPEKPLPLPNVAHHLTESLKSQFSIKQANKTTFKATIDPEWQQYANRIADIHNNHLSQRQINNLCVIVTDTKSGEVLAYVGNSMSDKADPGREVDIIRAPRSSGSILKPFLFAWMLEEGLLLPNELLEDIPVSIAGFRPENFHKDYDGAIPSNEALIRSLNIPFALLLRKYGIEKFLLKLRSAGFAHMKKGAAHYGLTLILGGAECSLWELTDAYRRLALSAQGVNEFNSMHTMLSDTNIQKSSMCSAGAAYLTLDILRELRRPDSEGDWKQYGSSREISWKTGTSHGFRDAWAVGVNQEYTIGVWVGNADGEGRPGLTGTEAAAPILFDLFRFRGGSEFFKPLHRSVEEVSTCRQSGFLAGSNCEKVRTMVPSATYHDQVCPYHKVLHLNRDSSKQVNASCYFEKPNPIHWFVLPPVMEHYYSKKHPEYKFMPPWDEGCLVEGGNMAIQFIYPPAFTEIKIPVLQDGSKGKVVFKAAHSDPQAILYWFMDNTMVGITEQNHQIELMPEQGEHILAITDHKGESAIRRVRVVY
jgi:penicillin-binding protein 1C